MKSVSLSVLSFAGYLFAIPYFLFSTYWLATSLRDGGLGGGLWEPGIVVTVITLPVSLVILPIQGMMEKGVGAATSLRVTPLAYYSVLGILYFIAIVINTLILFYAGKGLYKLVLYLAHL